MDIKQKRLVAGGHGGAATQDRRSNEADLVEVRAGSWQYGSETPQEAIEAEKRENDERFGVPCTDNLPAPSDGNENANDTLPNPHNFSNNPGFTGTSEMLTMSGPGSVIRTAGARRGLPGEPRPTTLPRLPDPPARLGGESRGGRVSGSSAVGVRPRKSSGARIAAEPGNLQEDAGNIPPSNAVPGT